MVFIMATIPNHPLREIADKIVAQAVPKSEGKEIQQLLYSAILYVKRVETKSLTKDERAFISHQQISFMHLAISAEIANAFRDRIRIIAEYKIRSASRIREMLLYGLERTSGRTFTKEEVDCLRILSKKPMASITSLSQKLRKSRYQITKTLAQLEEGFGLRRFFSSNQGKLKLTTFSLVFQTRSYEDSKNLESWVRETHPPFLNSFGFDVTYRNGCIVFAIPSQQRAYRLFEQRIEWLQRNYMERAHLQRAFEMFWNIHFKNYDHQSGQWRIPKELEDLRHLIDIINRGPIKIPYCYYSDLRTPTQFNQVDFLIASMNMNAHHTIEDVKEYVSLFGFEHSANSIWLHLKRLETEAIIAPMLYFSGGGFEDFINLSIHCSSDTQKQLQILASYFPAAFTYITEQGIAIFIKRPSGWGDLINRLIRDISQIYDIDDLMVIHQERNIGSGLGSELFQRWNEKRQYWEFKDEEI